MQNITIRPAVIEDSLDVSECVDAAYAKYIERIGKKPAPMLTDYKALIEAGHVFLMIGESRPLGILVAEPKADFLFIESIAVYPPHQGQGLGKK